MTIHTLAHKLTVSHFSEILSVLICQLAPKSNSHISQSFVRVVYKLLHSSYAYSVRHTRLQCIQISTRINSSSVHTYILRLFHSKRQSNIQHGVRIEAVATSLQEGESTDRIQQFPAYLQAS